MYVPHNKEELLKWFKRNRPDWKQSELKAMSKKQLYAIYFEERKA